MKVILDTNFLIYMAKKKIDYKEAFGKLLNENFELVVPMQVVAELKSLMNDKRKKVSGKDKNACGLALQLLEHNQVKKIKIKGDSVDEGIINLANEDKRNIVATLDREMRGILGRVVLINSKGRMMLKK